MVVGFYKIADGQSKKLQKHFIIKYMTQNTDLNLRFL